MERADFDRWIEEHYNELLAVARRRLYNRGDAQDVVQTAIITVLPHVPKLRSPWTFVVNAVRGAAAHSRDSLGRQRRLKTAVKYAEGLRDPAAFYPGRKPPALRAD